jgi:RNA polymerase sigma-70 factor (ECF subfamily)
MDGNAANSAWLDLGAILRSITSSHRVDRPSAEVGSADSSASLPYADLVAAIPRLRRYARVLTGNSAAADDLVQDTLARAWDKRTLWQPGTDLRAWLFTIMHRLFVNQLVRARHESRNVSLESDGEYSPALYVAEDGNQQSSVELSEVAQLMNRLPDDQREVLLLTAVEQLHYDEVAAVLSIPVGTVMSRLSRARNRLRRMIDEPQHALNAAKDQKRALSR